MQSIEIQNGVRVSFEDLLGGVAKMDTPLLEKFMDTLGHILANRKPGSSKGREEELMDKIENVVPAFIKRRYQHLHAKMQKETISESEHKELLQITDFIEEKAIERLHLLAELAALRNISLKELTESMRSKRYGHAAA